MITVNSKAKEITRGPDDWVIKHFDHAARQGVKVDDSRGEIEKVAYVAFVNPDGRRSLVLGNTGADGKRKVRAGSAMTEVAIPANSMTNLSWS